MKKILTITIFTIFLCSTIYSQNKFNQKKNDGYKISGEISGLQDSSVILAYYFGGKQYATDTANVINGKFVFKGDKKLKGGMYLIVLPDQQYFDIIVSEQEFSFSTNISDLVGSMQFKNSIENPPFYEYLNFIVKMQNDVMPLRKKLESASNEDKKEIQSEINKIDNKVKFYRDSFVKKNKKLFFSNVVNATTEIEIPKSPLDSLGNPDQTFPYRYYKKHFWDNMNFSDERMLRTPIFFSKMEQYFEKLTPKHPDSIIISADVLTELSRSNSEIFKYVVSHITSTYERSKIMGMDAVFVHMVEKYYITKQCDWIDEKQLEKIVDRAEKIAPNLIGKTSPEFITAYGTPFMKDLNNNIYTIQEIKAKYTVLIFFGPTCGHCKKEIPKVKNILDSLIVTGIDIKTMAVATEFDKKEWGKFIKDQKIEDWINVADINHDKEGNPVASSDWRDKYDIYSTPVIYLLDKEKKILAKRLSYKQLGDIITTLEK